ncbi:WD40-repeat-containing domain protein [Suillus americanus]|nr:WD40-repeat-containing domain protein [Suillus americanus]
MTMFATAGAYGEPISRPNTEHPVKIWDAKTGKLVTTLKGHIHWVYCLVWTPDGKTLISGSADCSIRTWNTSNWKQIAVLNGHTSYVYGIAISPNGRILASASVDSTARLWNLDNSQPICLPLKHEVEVAVVSFSADGKLLSTGCDDYNAYTWDVSAILKEASLDDLLLDRPDESLLAADATRRPVRQPIKVLNQVPRGFFDDAQYHAHSSAPHYLHPQSSPSHGSTLRTRFLSLFRPTHPDTSFRPRPFHWIRIRLFTRPSDADIYLHERPSVVDVSYAKGKRRNASARERRRLILKIPTTGGSRPPNSTVTQQSSVGPQTQSSSQSNAASTAPPVATSNTNPHATIKHAGRWSRFWLFVCCTSPEYTDGHH